MNHHITSKTYLFDLPTLNLNRLFVRSNGDKCWMLRSGEEQWSNHLLATSNTMQ